MEIIVALIAALAVLSLWVGWSAARLDRLGNRVDAARASLDAQLVRRAAAAQALVERTGEGLDPPLATGLRAASRAALEADDTNREAAENDLGRLLAVLPGGLDPDLLRDLADASARVVLARRFYNDAVRDTRALRSRRLPRLFGLAGGRPAPAFFEIADTPVAVPGRERATEADVTPTAAGRGRPGYR